MNMERQLIITLYLVKIETISKTSLSFRRFKTHIKVTLFTYNLNIILRERYMYLLSSSSEPPIGGQRLFLKVDRFLFGELDSEMKSCRSQYCFFMTKMV